MSSSSNASAPYLIISLVQSGWRTVPQLTGCLIHCFGNGLTMVCCCFLFFELVCSCVMFFYESNGNIFSSRILCNIVTDISDITLVCNYWESVLNSVFKSLLINNLVLKSCSYEIQLVTITYMLKTRVVFIWGSYWE